ncbi:MAG: hypothetical protein ALECFALPRED_006423 [Alectoria fallacina]|uniref:Uncharacterized protein n=1 Tax=Alectoria fallacina TaxID=1903189 RepID=A0A8H3IBN3_9LECA|nr:MAG: hypothetical protein ALECFALPRED_006423 [Alectoria fallacina]
MSSPPDTSLHSTTDTDANINTKNVPSSLSLDSSLPASRGDISSNGAMQRDSSDDDVRPGNTPTTAETTTRTALQIAEERHARQIQELEENHSQDLEALRRDLERDHELEIVELKSALYAAHKRDLLQLKEERERGLEHLKTFFSVAGAREESTVCSPTPSPTELMGELCSTCTAARMEARGGPNPASTAAASSTAPTTTSLPTSPEIPTGTNTAPSSPDTLTGPAAPHVHFLTTGITAADAKRAIEAKKAAGEGARAGRSRHEFGDKWVKNAMKVVVKVREGGPGGEGEKPEGKGKGKGV